MNYSLAFQCLYWVVEGMEGDWNLIERFYVALRLVRIPIRKRERGRETANPQNSSTFEF